MSERSAITEHVPTREGDGTSRMWRRTIQGRQYSFTAVVMPDGERRYFASRLQPGKDPRFACYWRPAGEWIVKPRATRSRASRAAR